MYVGENIGHIGQGGEQELERRIAAGGGRHVMALASGMMVDGVEGYRRAHSISMRPTTCLARGAVVEECELCEHGDHYSRADHICGSRSADCIPCSILAAVVAGETAWPPVTMALVYCLTEINGGPVYR